MDRGRWGEEVACAVLRANGYRIIARNWRTRMGEIDIIARDGDVLAFVEVKTRSNASYGGAAAAVGRHKQRRIILAAGQFLATTECDLPARFDVITVLPDETRLLRDAFRGDEICSAG